MEAQWVENLRQRNWTTSFMGPIEKRLSRHTKGIAKDIAIQLAWSVISGIREARGPGKRICMGKEHHGSLSIYFFTACIGVRTIHHLYIHRSR
jgi:hypothetical protein